MADSIAIAPLINIWAFCRNPDKKQFELEQHIKQTHNGRKEPTCFRQRERIGGFCCRSKYYSMCGRIVLVVFIENLVRDWCHGLSGYGNLVAFLGITRHMWYHGVALKATKCANILEKKNEVSDNKIFEVIYSRLRLTIKSSQLLIENTLRIPHNWVLKND